MLNIIIGLVSLILQDLTYIGIMFYFAGKPLKEFLCPKAILSFIAFVAFVYLLQNNSNDAVIESLVLLLFATTLYLKLNTKQSLGTSFRISVVGYFLESILQVAVIAIFSIFPVDYSADSPSSPVFLATIIATLVATILLCKFSPIHKLAKKIQASSFAISIVWLTLLSTFFIGFLLFEHYKSGLILPTAATLIIFIITGFIFVLEAMDANKRKKALRRYDTYMPIVDEMIHNIQSRQHLYNNQIQSLVYLSEKKDLTALQAAIHNFSNMSDTEEHAYNFLHLDNSLLAGLLHCKYQEAQKQMQKMVIQIHSYHFESSCNEFELVDLVGILLDNALENSKENETIYVEIGKPGNTNTSFAIKVENPGPIITDELKKSIFSKHYTTKQEKDGHGIGLSILKAIVQRYDGTIYLSNTTPDHTNETYFCIEIEL